MKAKLEYDLQVAEQNEQKAVELEEYTITREQKVEDEEDPEEIEKFDAEFNGKVWPEIPVSPF